MIRRRERHCVQALRKSADRIVASGRSEGGSSPHHTDEQGGAGHRKEEEYSVQLRELSVASRREQTGDDHRHHDVRSIGNEAGYGDRSCMTEACDNSRTCRLGIRQVLGRARGTIGLGLTARAARSHVHLHV